MPRSSCDYCCRPGQFAVSDPSTYKQAILGVLCQLLAAFEAEAEIEELPAFANIAAGQTDANIVTAVPGSSIKVTSVAVVTGATATNITFNSKPGGAGTAITALFANAANGGFVLGYNPKGWFETDVGEGLTVTTGAGATTGITLKYELV